MSLQNRITIKEVAQKAGVSIASVSRYLNSPSSLKENTLKKIEKVAVELNYQPLVFARRLAGGKLNTFGLIIPGYEDIFYSFYALEIMRGVAASIEKKDIDLYLNIFWGKDNFKTSFVDGIVFSDVLGNEEQLKRLHSEGIPLVVLNKRMDDLVGVSYVAIDNFKGAYEATEFLINHGHKKIVHFAGDLRVECAKERLQGFKAALEKNHIHCKDENIKGTNFSRRIAREKMEELLKQDSLPTAIFCCSDDVASEVLSFCEERKIEVPKRLSIIGFDDNPHCLYGNIMLTTVRQPIKRMATLGVEILQDIMDKHVTPQKIMLDTELVIRDTVNFL